MFGGSFASAVALKITGNAAGFLSAVRASEGAIFGLRNRVFALKSAFALARVAGTSMAAIGGAVIAAMGLLGKSALEADVKFGELATLLSETEQQLIPALEEGIKQVAVAFGVDLIDAISAAYTAISRGTEPAKAIDFITQATKSAIGGVTSLENATGALSNVLNAFGRDTVTVEEAADALFFTVKKGSTTFNEFGPVLGRVALEAASTGLTIEEMCAAAAVISRTIPQASQFVTAFAGVLRNLRTPTGDVAKAFADYDIEVGKAAVSSVGFAAKIREIIDVTDGEAEALRRLFPERKANLAIQALMADSMGTFNEIMAATGEIAGSSEAAFTTMADRTSFAFTQAKSSLQTLKEEMGNVILVAFEPWANKLSELTEKTREWIRANREASESFTLVSGAVSGVGTSLGIFLGVAGLVSFSILNIVALCKMLIFVFSGMSAVAIATFLSWVIGIGLVAKMLWDACAASTAFLRQWKKDRSDLSDAEKKFVAELLDVNIKTFAELESVYETFFQTKTAALDKTLQHELDTTRQIIEGLLRRKISVEELTEFEKTAAALQISVLALTLRARGRMIESALAQDDFMTIFMGNNVQERINLLMLETGAIDDKTDSQEKEKKSLEALVKENNDAKSAWKEAIANRNELAETADRNSNEMIEANRKVGETTEKMIASSNALGDGHSKNMETFRTEIAASTDLIEFELDNLASKGEVTANSLERSIITRMGEGLTEAAKEGREALITTIKNYEEFLVQFGDVGDRIRKTFLDKFLPALTGGAEGSEEAIDEVIDRLTGNSKNSITSFASSAAEALSALNSFANTSTQGFVSALSRQTQALQALQSQHTAMGFNPQDVRDLSFNFFGPVSGGGVEDSFATAFDAAMGRL